MPFEGRLRHLTRLTVGGSALVAFIGCSGRGAEAPTAKRVQLSCGGEPLGDASGSFELYAPSDMPLRRLTARAPIVVHIDDARLLAEDCAARTPTDGGAARRDVAPIARGAAPRRFELCFDPT